MCSLSPLISTRCTTATARLSNQRSPTRREVDDEIVIEQSGADLADARARRDRARRRGGVPHQAHVGDRAQVPSGCPSSVGSGREGGTMHATVRVYEMSEDWDDALVDHLDNAFVPALEELPEFV